MSGADNVSDIVARIIQRFERLEGIRWLSGVKDELQRIKCTLLDIDRNLLCARERRFTSGAMTYWLSKLNFVVIDLEDVVDLILTLDLELKGDVTQKLKANVTQKLKAVGLRLYQRCHIPQAVGSPVQSRSYFFADASSIIGRQEDKERIIHYLKCCPELDPVESFPVIAVVGIVGIGKTTLVSLVYHDADVVASFELRLWVSFDSKFDLRSLMIDILHNFKDRRDFSHFSRKELQNMLIEKLCGRTVLLVVDDVWFKDSAEWKDLRDVLELCGVGARSRIIVTTREKRVVSITGAMKEYNLESLSDEDCWSLFAEYAFKGGEERFYPNLVRIGRSIVWKCHGNPLVAETVGAFLKVGKAEEVWKSIESDFSQIVQLDDMILSDLTLTYDRIPYSLRSCFAQCAVYGNGQPLFRTDVINTWMALGLLDSKETYEDLEGRGERYFNELLSRSLFQPPGYDVAKKVIIEYGKIFDGSMLWADITEMFESDWKNNLNLVLNTFFQPVQELLFLEMPDLHVQLATHVLGNEISAVTSDSLYIPEETMHILCKQEDLSNATWRFTGKRKARLFAFGHSVGRVSESFLKGLISCLECLRVLDLSSSEFEQLPDSVGDLKHLRCLKLGWNSKLVGLPDSVCKLVNLQTLELFRCTALEKLPKDIQKLVSLRFLSLSSKLISLPDGLFGLPSLRVLR